jgi:hypothetical protein
VKKMSPWINYVGLNGLFWICLWFGYVMGSKFFTDVSCFWIILMVLGTFFVYSERERRKAILDGKAFEPEWVEVSYNLITLGFLIWHHDLFMAFFYAWHSVNCAILHQEKKKMNGNKEVNRLQEIINKALVYAKDHTTWMYDIIPILEGKK